MRWLPLAIITALTASVLLQAGTAEARATRIPFTSTEYCAITSFGTWTSPDGNLHIRGLTLECTGSTTMPQLDGTNHYVWNANLDATGSGPAWGTWRLETEDGGWEGAYHTTVTGFLSAEPHDTGRGVGHGTGIYEGQQLFADTVTTGLVNTITGYILVP
jgi:hypothetical protein